MFFFSVTQDKRTQKRIIIIRTGDVLTHGTKWPLRKTEKLCCSLVGLPLVNNKSLSEWSYRTIQTAPAPLN